MPLVKRIGLMVSVDENVGKAPVLSERAGGAKDNLNLLGRVNVGKPPDDDKT